MYRLVESMALVSRISYHKANIVWTLQVLSLQHGNEISLITTPYATLKLQKKKELNLKN